MKNLNLIEARKKSGFTQKQLADRLHCAGKSTISNWENGHSKPRLAQALLISRILEEDVSFLFGYYVQESCTKQVV
ncbi:helix-turn-helix transcriptional regulator [Viridibacillus arvi]|uniref:helix-turn-helix transcriptional regulator n=1 Tax=Viridibacillus arvi TaxID=263475 RepID=UPI003D280541